MRNVILLHDQQYDRLTHNVSTHVAAGPSSEDIVAMYRSFIEDTLNAVGH